MPLIFGIDAGFDGLSGKIEILSERKVVVTGLAELLESVGGRYDHPIKAVIELAEDGIGLVSYSIRFAEYVIEKDAEYIVNEDIDNLHGELDYE
jgi:hypothetical protein